MFDIQNVIEMLQTPSSSLKNKVPNKIYPFYLVGDPYSEKEISVAKWHPTLNKIITYADMYTKTLNIVDTNNVEVHLHSIDISEVSSNHFYSA